MYKKINSISSRERVLDQRLIKSNPDSFFGNAVNKMSGFALIASKVFIVSSLLSWCIPFIKKDDSLKLENERRIAVCKRQESNRRHFELKDFFKKFCSGEWKPVYYLRHGREISYRTAGKHDTVLYCWERSDPDSDPVKNYWEPWFDSPLVRVGLRGYWKNTPLSLPNWTLISTEWVKEKSWFEVWVKNLNDNNAKYFFVKAKYPGSSGSKSDVYQIELDWLTWAIYSKDNTRWKKMYKWQEPFLEMEYKEKPCQ